MPQQYSIGPQHHFATVRYITDPKDPLRPHTVQPQVNVKQYHGADASSYATISNIFDGITRIHGFPSLAPLPSIQPQSNSIEDIADLTYIVNGRVLKQYLVMEHHDDDNTIDSYLNNPYHRSTYIPYLPHLNFDRSNKENYGFGQGQPMPTPLPMAASPRSAQLNVNSGAIAVGSGSLGFVRHPSGAIFLGSGSLGYINDQQRADAITSIKNRQSPEPGPLSFGRTPK